MPHRIRSFPNWTSICLGIELSRDTSVSEERTILGFEALAAVLQAVDEVRFLKGISSRETEIAAILRRRRLAIVQDGLLLNSV